MGVVREVEEDVVGLYKTRHRLERTRRRGGMARGRGIGKEMVVGRRREGERDEQGGTPSIILLSRFDVEWRPNNDR